MARKELTRTDKNDRVRMVVHIDRILADKFNRILMEKRKSHYYLSRECEVAFMWYLLHRGKVPEKDDLKGVYASA